jgi:hypothetical protein
MVRHLGLRGAGGLGFSLAFMDQTMLIITAPFDNVTASQTKGPVGKAIAMARNEFGTWSEKFHIYGDEVGPFGFSSFVTDTEVLIAGFFQDWQGAQWKGHIYSFNKCLPIDVTCKDVQLNDCSTLPLDTLYTINNPQCGAVEALAGTPVQTGNKVIVPYNFTKESSVATCNATVTCPKTSGANAIAQIFASTFVALVGYM